MLTLFPIQVRYTHNRVRLETNSSYSASALGIGEKQITCNEELEEINERDGEGLDEGRECCLGGDGSSGCTWWWYMVVS